MKLNKALFIGFIGILCINGFTQNSPYNDYFGMGSRLGVITGNNVQFYEFDNNTWTLNENYSLTLPNGHRGVFEWHNFAIGVVVNNEIQIFEFIDNSWINYTLNISLPNGYRSVFGLGGIIIGVVSNNRVQIYTGNYTDWTLDQQMGFNLPRGYSGVIGIGIIGVIVNNRLQAYHTFGDVLDFFNNFALPRGYRSIFRISSLADGTPTLGIVTNNGVQFYELLNNSWSLNTSYNFIK